jgi:hypothetical protein
MLSWGIGLMIAGVVVMLGFFVFAAINMGRGIAKETTAEGLIGGHITAMVGIAVSGVAFLAGVITTILHFVMLYLPNPPA